MASSSSSSLTIPKNNIDLSFPHLLKIQGVIRNTQQAYTNIVSKVRDEEKPIAKPENEEQFKINNPNMIRGGLIGVVVSALISWNAGKYSRLGILKKRWKFVRNFIIVNRKPQNLQVFTNYYVPPLDTVVKNFMCYSGQAGIGKSTHFMHLAYTQSGIRPALYVSFKASGKDTTFEQDIAQQVDYGSDCPGILSQIIRAVQKIDKINKHPQQFWIKNILANLFFAGAAYGIAVSELQAMNGIILFGALGISYIYYINFIYPFFIQSFRRTCPLIIFDDLNKIQHINMLPEIVRYLQLLQHNMANVILVSPDEDTWSKLRRQPGVKDRLRVRQIYYNHLYTSEAILKFINNDQNVKTYMKHINANKLYSKDIVISLVRQLIGKRQVTLRRFSSILVLNDEQQCEKLTKVLSDCAEGKMSKGEAVQQFTDILYDSEARTMVANLKSIKRQVKMPEDQFLNELKLLLNKRKLPSDHQIAPHLKAYNIVRDLQSEYIFNGRFMFTVFNMAIQQYEQDLKQYKSLNEKQSPSVLHGSINESSGPVLLDPVLTSSLKMEQSQKSQKNEEMIRNWNNSNVSSPSIIQELKEQKSVDSGKANTDKLKQETKIK